MQFNCHTRQRDLNSVQLAWIVSFLTSELNSWWVSSGLKSGWFGQNTKGMKNATITDLEKNHCVEAEGGQGAETIHSGTVTESFS
jgi:hypothetical protein